MANEGYHEPVNGLRGTTRDLHRAIVSLMEELEAVDRYQQRADACKDAEWWASTPTHARSMGSLPGFAVAYAWSSAIATCPTSTLCPHCLKPSVTGRDRCLT